MDQISLGISVNFIMWIFALIGPLMFFMLLREGNFTYFSVSKKIGALLGFVIFPIAFFLSKLLGDDFINSLPVLDTGAMIFDAIDLWAVIFFLGTGLASSGKARAFSFAACVAGLMYIVLGYQYFNNLMTIVWGAIDISLGLIGVMGSKLIGSLNR